MKLNFWKKESTKTKWLPIHVYQYAYDEYMVYARFNIDTGIFDFRTDHITKNTFGAISRQIPINTKTQLEKLLNQEV